MDPFTAAMLGLSALTELVQLVGHQINVAKQSEETTPEQLEELERIRAEVMALPHWQIEPDPETPQES